MTTEVDSECPQSFDFATAAQWYSNWARWRRSSDYRPDILTLSLSDLAEIAGMSRRKYRRILLIPNHPKPLNPQARNPRYPARKCFEFLFSPDKWEFPD